MKKVCFILLTLMVLMPINVLAYDTTSSVSANIKYNKSTLNSIDFARFGTSIEDDYFNLTLGINDWPVFDWYTYSGITTFPITVTNKNGNIPGQTLVESNLIATPTISFFWVLSSPPPDEDDESWVPTAPGTQIIVDKNGVGTPVTKSIVAQDGNTYDISDLISNIYGWGTTLSEFRQAKQSLKTAGLTELETIQHSPLIARKIISKDDYLVYFPIDITKSVNNLEVADQIDTPSSIAADLDKMTWRYEVTAFLESVFEITTDVTLAKPGININNNIAKIDTLVTSKQFDDSDMEWYGTFQVKKAGSSVWEDVETNFMDSTTTDGLPIANLSINSSYNNAKIRYKYVHGYDTDKIVYSEEETINIYANPDTSDSITNIIILMIISIIGIITFTLVLKKQTLIKH